MCREGREGAGNWAPGIPGMGDPSWFAGGQQSFITNRAILVVRVGASFYEVFVFGRQAQAIQISAAQAAYLEQFGVPSIVLT